MIKLSLVPVGDLGPEMPLLRWLRDRVGIALMVPVVEIGGAIEHPSYAYDPSRGQYKASDILERLRESASGLGPPALGLDPASRRSSRVLGVTDVDLFAGGLSFVFGQAELPGTAAVISLQRLKPEFYGRPPDENLKRRRSLVEAVHEVGHTFGLDHCGSRRCVMRFSNVLPDTDAKGHAFCPSCFGALSVALRRAEGRE